MVQVARRDLVVITSPPALLPPAAAGLLQERSEGACFASGVAPAIKMTAGETVGKSMLDT